LFINTAVVMENNLNFIELRIKNVDELLKETHDYIKWQAPVDVEYMSQEDIFKVSCEAMRVTVRLTQIVSWLMLQKAILAGEISRKALLVDISPILQGKPCLEESSEVDPFFPPRLRELLRKSRELYVQTLRLEEMSLKNSPLPEEIKKRRAKGYHAVPLLRLKKT